jgi:hypothetical protein
MVLKHHCELFVHVSQDAPNFAALQSILHRQSTLCCGIRPEITVYRISLITATPEAPATEVRPSAAHPEKIVLTGRGSNQV